MGVRAVETMTASRMEHFLCWHLHSHPSAPSGGACKDSTSVPSDDRRTPISAPLRPPHWIGQGGHPGSATDGSCATPRSGFAPFPLTAQDTPSSYWLWAPGTPFPHQRC